MLKDVSDRVAFIMDNYPDTRDNDTKLICKYMNLYHNAGIQISQLEQMLKGPSFASIIRERSRFQNTLKQYQPSKEIKKQRHQTEKEFRNRYGPMYLKDF